MKGIVTDIQRFSLKDGPGIRTTVFLQGCNMACAWCHNPETISLTPQLLYYEDNCIHCGKCREGCFAGARVWSGKEMTAEEVLDEVFQDEAYYKNSGGGITISGGEVMLQPDFAYELLRSCKERGIHTAIETNLNVSWSRIEKLLPVLDLIMCDIKHMDDEKHRTWTGAGNALILANIKELAKNGVPVIIRTPVIPGVNQTKEEIAAIAGYIKESQVNLLYYELLNFNPLGDTKYKGLNKENCFYGQKPADEKLMQSLADAATAQGIPVRVG